MVSFIRYSNVNLHSPIIIAFKAAVLKSITKDK
jgi:hypothetical protein